MKLKFPSSAAIAVLTLSLPAVADVLWSFFLFLALAFIVAAFGIRFYMRALGPSLPFGGEFFHFSWL